MTVVMKENVWIIVLEKHFFNAHMVLHLSMPSSEAVAENISVYLSVLMITQRSHASFKIS